MKMHASEHAARMAMMALATIVLLACGREIEKPKVSQTTPPSLAIQHATAALPDVAGVFSNADGDADDAMADDEVAVTDAVLTGSRQELRTVATASRHYAIYIRYLAELKEAAPATDMQQANYVTGNLDAAGSALACERPQLDM